MYVRDARNREEVWLLDHIEGMGLDDAAFRSRDYVIAVDESSNEKAGFGRIRIHRGEESACELTGIGVLENWRGQGVGAHVVERLDEKRETVGPDVVPVALDVGAFAMPTDRREAFKEAPAEAEAEPAVEETPEDFGIDSESATYKYDTG